MTAERRIWFAVVVASLGWGTSAVATRVALGESVPPFALAGFRSTLAMLVIAGFLVARRRSSNLDVVSWKVGVVMGITNLALPLITANIALQYASAGFVALPAALIPLFTALAAHVMLPDEPMHPTRTVGLLVALVGVAVLVLSGDAGLDEGGRPLIAGVLSLVGVVSIALGSVYAKRYVGRYSALDVVGVQFAVGSSVALTAMLIVEGAPAVPSALGSGAIVYMSLATTVMPFLIYYWLIKHVTVTYSSIIGYIVPLVAVTIGIIALDERLQFGIILGGLLILAGVIVTDRIEANMRVARAAARAE